MKYPIRSLLGGLLALGLLQTAAAQTTSDSTTTTIVQSGTVMTGSGLAPVKPSVTTNITPGQADFKLFAEKPHNRKKADSRKGGK